MALMSDRILPIAHDLEVAAIRLANFRWEHARLRKPAEHFLMGGAGILKHLSQSGTSHNDAMSTEAVTTDLLRTVRELLVG
jgi:hypothetical protein